ncbi:hypothetical protein WK60_08670 [Burkholderia ubonensis]|nr:plasmid partitioning protein RepB C-terminal domain-containing protein [Burkholderia ubonensis]KVT96597.1 hypothetical protein WK60_08670 [Burkholderia ubonensis]
MIQQAIYSGSQCMRLGGAPALESNDSAARHQSAVSQAQRCLSSTRERWLTYNKRVSRVAAIQEHNMILKVHESGVPIEHLAAALGLSARTIRARFRMLGGICDEAIRLLADKRVPGRVFSILRQMKPFRQIDVAHAMNNLENHSGKFALAMLETTPDDQLVDGPKEHKATSGTVEAI